MKHELNGQLLFMQHISTLMENILELSLVANRILNQSKLTDLCWYKCYHVHMDESYMTNRDDLGG